MPAGDGDARVGTVLADRYRIHALLGEGGMGKVYAAEHVLMRKRLAIKVLHRELTLVPDVVRRFEREAMAAANIEHPNVAAATDFGKLPDGSVFLVLEYVLGRNLRDVIAEGPMRVSRALHIARQIASALGSAHLLKIVHRDLKPENVMLVEKGGDQDFVKVLDFGIAKVPIGEVSESGRPPSPGSALTKVGMVFGTPEYMAPEQALGQTVDGRADLYALGVILYEMIAGIRPFSSQSQVGILGQQLSKPVPRFSERSPGVPVPEQVERLVQKMLGRDVAERYQTADEVVDAIDGIVGAPARGRRPIRSEASLTELRLQRQDAGVRDELPSIPELDSTDLLTELPQAAGSTKGPAWDPSKSAAAPIHVAATEPAPAPKPVPPPKPANLAAPRPNLAAWQTRARALGVQLQERTRGLTLAARAALRKLGHQAGLSVQAATLWIDGSRSKLPERVRQPLSKVSSRALLGAACAVVFLFVLVLVFGIGSLLSPGRADPQAAQAPAASGALPSPGGAPDIAALERAAREQPGNAKALVALAQARGERGEYKPALESLQQALRVDPKLLVDPAVQPIVREAAQKPDAQEAAFALLEDGGAPGADLLYDLALDTSAEPTAQKRAESWLTTSKFQKNSSPQLNVAVALKHARSCTQRYGLLLRARNVGDQRSLKYLKAWESKVGCGAAGRSDCNPCLRTDKLLSEAIAAIQSRSAK